MDSFIERFCAKYYFPYAEGRQLIEGMEYKTYRKGDCLVREGERDTSFYIIARGIWRGHYLRDGQEVSVWFASEGEALCNHSIFRHDNFIGCFSADKIKMSARK